MKIFALYIINLKPQQQQQQNSRIILSSTDLSSVGWFQRGSVGQVMSFTAKTVSERTNVGQRSTIDEQDYTAYVYRPQRYSDLAVVTVTDKEYPKRAAECIGPNIIQEFVSKFNSNKYSNPEEKIIWPELDLKLSQYQTPSNAMDKVSQIQSELDATKEIMHKNIDQVLQRGERLEDLMERTEELDNATKLFVKQAKKANRRCCSLQ